MNSFDKEKQVSKNSRSSLVQTTLSISGILDSLEIKIPPLPTLQEISQKYLPKEILKETQTNLSERKIIWEKQAQIEEKDRIEREKKSHFNEREFEFNGENDLEELLPATYEEIKDLTCKSTRGIMDTLKIKGFANLPLDFRAFFKIKEEELPISKEKSIYLSFKKMKQKNPHLYKFTRKSRFREMHDVIKSYHEIDSESIPTMTENSKRGEIMAKLYMKLNLEEALEKKRKEEEAKAKEEAETKALAEIPESDEINGIKAIHEDDEESEDPEDEQKRKAEELKDQLNSLVDGQNVKEINEKIKELLMNKQMSIVGINKDDLQKIMLINENFEEIINYFDNRVMENFERENYEECVYLKGKKEEFVASLKNYNDYESLLRTLIIYKLNNNI